jgi:uncharacterized RDD family membrane protein YckC
MRATWGARFVGRFMDNLVLVGPLVAFLVIAAITDSNGMFGFAFPLALVSSIGAQAWSIAATGRSLGKRAAGTRVVRLDGTPTGFLRGFFLREVILWVASATRILGVINGVMVFGAARRTGHDYLLGTVVVDEASYQSRIHDIERVAEVFR